ncbi:NAD(P)H-dependent oxidoreductase [Clostridium sp. D2Q-11]|uniref:NAD(P)H-dependent oxidoreductase n=1 Tax=Anaeromonas frigoriresistens TaxID=2683708 RepID=A0A942UQB7_9FIRM|nr:NAD(P)H-dependent oxidoreductase [Anaeromonas frigoriresistens]MBS4537243.1 NAD(P)H-dependent oxidoreductase [Anaeromonas frigoriresistens]
MNKIHVIVPETPSDFLLKMVKETVMSNEFILIKNVDNLPNLQNKKILFAIELDHAGGNVEINRIFNKLFTLGNDSLKNSTGSVLVHNDNELYTKTMAQNIIFNGNRLGCRFPGRPLVEATGSLSNMKTIANALDLSLEEACFKSCNSLGETLQNDNPKKIDNPKLLVLHSSNYTTSNTLRLWEMSKRHLDGIDINEIHIENGTVRDCIGCPYTTCKHYGQQTSCFYGGIMVEEVYPAILNADAILWICPNYNDAISANLTAVINRLTALFRKTKFYDKSIFSVIVSGNSGGDSIAKQLISALNINKTFRLPPYFSIMATANNKDAILHVPNIEDKAKRFALNIKNEIE